MICFIPVTWLQTSLKIDKKNTLEEFKTKQTIHVRKISIKLVLDHYQHFKEIMVDPKLLSHWDLFNLKKKLYSCWVLLKLGQFTPYKDWRVISGNSFSKLYISYVPKMFTIL